MGNCIGRKSRVQKNYHRYSSTNNQLGKISILPSTEQINVLVSNNDEHQVIQCSSSIITNDRSSDLLNDSSENITLITHEEDITMGYLFSKEIISESFDTSSSSPSFSNSSFTHNSTSFSSQDQIILSQSSSSSFSIDLLSQSSKNEIFSTSISCFNNKNLFYQNIISHTYNTLSSIIDDIIQQQFIRIHRQTKTIFIEHKQFQCIHINDINQFDRPSLIFDEDQKFVYITKYGQYWNEFQLITNNIKDNISRIFSSCNYCSLLLSGWKLNQYLYSFLIVNTTYNLIKICFNEIDKKNNLFGYISKINQNQIRQTIINNSKLNYSYDLDVNHTNIYFVLRVKSWPNKIRLIYEKRQRLWPLNIKNLFDQTCFIRYNGNEEEIFTNNQCFNCEKMLSSVSNSSWCYTYAAIEAQLILLMSDEQIRFASIVWNYLNGKTQGEFSFNIFKHILFYFFEHYSSDSFTTSDLFSYISLFIDYLFNCLQTKFIPHYFNSNYNLYNENITMNFISFKMTYLDLKKFSIYLLPKTSLYLYHLMYLIQFQSQFLQYFSSSKTNLIQTILDTHELVIKQLSSGVKTYKRQLDSNIAIQLHRPLTLDCLYQYQEENVQIILDYLPLLREKEPSLVIHLFWSIFIQYFNSLFDDLFIS